MKTYIVDSFTEKPFKGNPAGVCVIEASMSDELMLKVAQELGLSETAFIHPISGSKKYSIRYFSPKMEIPLCGHATLAAAKVLISELKLAIVKFVNKDNLTLIAKNVGKQIEMEFPIYTTQPAEVSSDLLKSLQLSSVENVAHNVETNILLLEIKNYKDLANITPDFTMLLESRDDINGVLVTASSGTDGYDFHSRYFWPWSGTNEDPVTGGTHTFLAPYWSERLGKNKMLSFQSSKRTGSMQVELLDDKLFITSQAVIILQGEMDISGCLE